MAETQTPVASQADAPEEPAVSLTAGDVKQEEQSTEVEQPEPEPAPEPEGAPEKYEFKAPENTKLDEKMIETFADAARELNLTQDAAQSIIDKIVPVMDARAAEIGEALKAERSEKWQQEVKADKELGGDKSGERLAVARKTFEKFGTPELKTLLIEEGLGNHPELVRWAYRVGRAISEDTLVTATSPTAGERDLNDPTVQKQVFYGKKE